jgi:ectoine hydroxylase-related dioxygenase (phytanoyl-CoA dioxygenase family)
MAHVHERTHPAVTADQARTYRRDGWVRVPGFVDADTAGAMAEQARRYERGGVGGVQPRDLAMWREWRFVARDDRTEPFVALAFDGSTGRAVSDLEGRGGSVRYWNDVLTRKSGGSAAHVNTGTGWHQDFPNHPIDRLGGATLWLALEDLEPDQGTMCFLSGSHRAGPLGRTYSTGPTPGGTDQLAQHPWLRDEYERSEPLSMRAGDATFHHPLVVHGTEPNRSDRARWAFIVMVVAAEAVYTGASYPTTDDLGLRPGGPIDHPRFPIVWNGAAT